MYDEQVKASFIAWSNMIADARNQEQTENYFGACRNWAIHAQGPAPIAPFSVLPEISFDPEFSLVLKPTTAPVSDVSPLSFRPKYGTDIDAVGGPVGGPIKGVAGKFHIAAGANANPGDKYTAPDGREFVYVRTGLFIGYWEVA